jgi:hypothetical protein
VPALLALLALPRLQVASRTRLLRWRHLPPVVPRLRLWRWLCLCLWRQALRPVVGHRPSQVKIASSRVE